MKRHVSEAEGEGSLEDIIWLPLPSLPKQTKFEVVHISDVSPIPPENDMATHEQQPAVGGANDLSLTESLDRRTEEDKKDSIKNPDKPDNRLSKSFFVETQPASESPNCDGPNWTVNGPKAAPTDGTRKKLKKKNKKTAVTADTSRGTVSEDAGSELSTDEAVSLPDTEESHDDVRMRLDMGLPGSFVSGRPMKRTTEKPSRAKSSSSERGVVGFSDAVVQKRPSRRSDWEIMRTGGKCNEDADSTTASAVKEEDGDCCEVESKDSELKSGTTALPDHEEQYIDSHCHMDFIWGKQPFKDMDVLRTRFKDAFPSTFKGCIANFIKPVNWAYSEWIEAVVKDNQVLGTSWGIHPHNAATVTEEDKEKLCEMLENHKEILKIVAVGECGIDLSERNDVPLERQLEIFQFQVNLAYKHDLPLIIHCREGKGQDKDPEDAVLNVLKARPNHPIHRHCFTRDVEVADKWMNTLHNCTFGFTPMITTEERFVPLIKHIPFDRIHLETDAPYFKTNLYSAFSQPHNYSVPGAAITVAIRISEITGVPLEEVIRATRLCTQRIYRLPMQ